MEHLIIFGIVFVITFVIWVIVLVLYSALIESFDFGPLLAFAAKSAILVALVSLTRIYVPWGGWLSLLVWGLGLVVLFRMDLWEARILVVLIWGLNFVVGIGLFLLLARMNYPRL